MNDKQIIDLVQKLGNSFKAAGVDQAKGAPRPITGPWLFGLLDLQRCVPEVSQLCRGDCGG